MSTHQPGGKSMLFGLGAVALAALGYASTTTRCLSTAAPLMLDAPSRPLRKFTDARKAEKARGKKR